MGLGGGVKTLYAEAVGLHQRILIQETSIPKFKVKRKPFPGHTPQGGPRQPPLLEARPTAQPLWHCSLGTGTLPFVHWQMHALMTINLVPECVSIFTYIRHYGLLESMTEIYSCTHILAFCIPKPLVPTYQVPVHYLSHWVPTQHVLVPESLCDQ